MSAAPIASVEPVQTKSFEPGCAVSCTDGEHRLVALSSFEPGDIIMMIDGEKQTAPNRYSVQITRNLHVAPPQGMGSAGRDRWLWRFVNHSCRPNSAVMRKRLVAMKSISPGDEITFDYNANEFDMASPFHCHCGHCGGIQIRGFRHLTPAQRQARYHFLADHLRDLMDEHTVE